MYRLPTGRCIVRLTLLANKIPSTQKKRKQKGLARSVRHVTASPVLVQVVQYVTPVGIADVGLHKQRSRDKRHWQQMQHDMQPQGECLNSKFVLLFAVSLCVGMLQNTVLVCTERDARIPAVLCCP